MTYIKSHSSTSSWGRLHYIFDEDAHDGSDHRVLSAVGANINLWGARGHPIRDQSGYYLNTQFKNIRHRAWNTRKHQQAQHLILSFSESEFNTENNKNLTKEADQISALVKKFMDAKFSDCQWVSGVQCDGEGHKLHAHVLINSVKPDGKCVRTNKFKVSKLRNDWNNFMDENYLSVTGHVYINPFNRKKPATTTKPKGWQEQLQKTLEWACSKASSIENYLTLIKDKGVTVSERNKRGDWCYHLVVNEKEKVVRDFYQRIDKKTGSVKSTRGLGLQFTPKELEHYFKIKKENYNNGRRKENIRTIKKIGSIERVDESRERGIFLRNDEQRETGNTTRYSKSGNRSHESVRRTQHESDFEC